MGRPGEAAGGWVRPLTLHGRRVRLEPLTRAHLPALVEVGLEPEIWRWMLSPIESAADLGAWVDAALAEAAAGNQLPFATIDLEHGRAVGSSRYLALEPRHRRLEIGYTWIAPPWQRGHVNTEAKLLMLGHAFEVLGALRVEFKTDSLNVRSRRALAGIGAQEEGTLRNHMLTDTGRRRHSTYFSVIAEEWPEVRRRLEARLSAGTATP